MMHHAGWDGVNIMTILFWTFESTVKDGALDNLRELVCEMAEKAKTTDHVFSVVVAIIIGVLGGIGAVGFRFLIKFFQRSFWGQWEYTTEFIHSLPWYHVVFAPALGGLLVGLVVHFFAREAKGHGVPEVMESVALRNGLIRPRVVVAVVIQRKPTPARADAFHGALGAFAQAVAQESEADRHAVLAQGLVYFGAIVGRGPYVQLGGGAPHRANEFTRDTARTPTARNLCRN